MDNKGIQLVAAVCYRSNGMGFNGKLPWPRLREDMSRFTKLTSEAAGDSINAVVMGRKTYESLPEKYRPLPGRLNVILSRSGKIEAVPSLAEVNEGGGCPAVVCASSLDNALEWLETRKEVDNIFVTGGAQVYAEAMAHKACTKIHLTSVFKEFECDTVFPTIDMTKFTETDSSEIVTEKNIALQFFTYTRTDTPLAEVGEHVAPHEEMQYINLIKDILNADNLREDRTGTGVYSVFGRQMRFSLRNNTLPLLTTKRVFWRGVAEELLWFVSGSTNANLLADKGVRIWDGNSSREFLDNLGFTDREVGDLGPVYGFQWRHFGAEYKDMHHDYTGEGVDQLSDVIETIKNNPTSRRIVMSAWNPSDLKKMALPPCHILAQFYVSNGELSCHLYQRSADVGLGVPFNIASYSLLTRLMAQVCDLEAGDFVYTLGDAHIYSNHVDALKQQIERAPKEFPQLFINQDKTDIDSFEFSDFVVKNYRSYKSIPMKMAV